MNQLFVLIHMNPKCFGLAGSDTNVQAPVSVFAYIRLNSVMFTTAGIIIYSFTVGTFPIAYTEQLRVVDSNTNSLTNYRLFLAHLRSTPGLRVLDEGRCYQK